MENEAGAATPPPPLSVSTPAPTTHYYARRHGATRWGHGRAGSSGHAHRVWEKVVWEHAARDSRLGEDVWEKASGKSW